MEGTLPRHAITRLRQETRRRVLTLATIEQLTPHMLRLGFVSPELHDFASAAPDDHVKLFFPTAEGSCMRDYTPRRFDPAAGTLVLDFALHEAGPATRWAMKAKPGDALEIGGPRGSAVVADDFDWYLLIGDETALPAIGRRIEELRPGVPVTSFVLVPEAADAQHFSTAASWSGHWIARGASTEDGALLLAAIADFTLPPGDGFIWIAAEAQAARAVRHHVLETLGHPRAWVKTAGYWLRGVADAHERIED
ncbi:siderophore-interacting protein [Roseococcus pinisoli]|uniref:Siderophore-interacting protein n=1 Tax=Roseococcus pinisoli TaxID=2835040 RepID=A0ABS5QC82_9PROT|nr:siderophore-interacting protein [Roseococcus pinisoli]MBS7811289.1 siderophore-interacting protein [Roseococcus pinisoli]